MSRHEWQSTLQSGFPEKSIHENNTGLMISISIFSCQGIITNMVLSFPCIIISAGVGRLLGCFTQTLAPIASISLMDPNWPSLLTVSKMGDILFHALTITHGQSQEHSRSIWQSERHGVTQSNGPEDQICQGTDCYSLEGPRVSDWVPARHF